MIVSQVFPQGPGVAVRPVGVGGGGIAVNVAIHVLLASMVTCPPAVHAPLHPAKVEDAFGVAVAVTEAHEVYVHAPVVVPPPVPAVLMVRVY